MHSVKLVMTGPSRGELFIDGKKVEGVKAAEIRAGVDEINTVSMTLNCESVEVEGDFYTEGVVDITSIGDESRRFRKMTRWECFKRWWEKCMEPPKNWPGFP